MQFISRDFELGLLNDFYHYHRAALFLLYGQRDVGKTRLVQEWLARAAVPSVLQWTATLDQLDAQLDSFVGVLAHFAASLSHGLLGSPEGSIWESAFEYFGELAEAAQGPVLLVIDEFTQLVQLNPGLASDFQIAWDHRLSHLPNVRILLLGSAVRVMDREVLSYRAPLYGRATHVLKLRPLPFGVLRGLLPNWSAAERVAVYAVTGGIPPLLSNFVGATDFNSGLPNYLARHRALADRATCLLRAQVSSLSLAERVLSAIASGAQDRKQVAAAAGVRSGRLGSVLKRLAELDLLEETAPLLGPSYARDCRYDMGL